MRLLRVALFLAAWAIGSALCMLAPSSGEGGKQASAHFAAAAAANSVQQAPMTAEQL
jgi:hypothetical protein